MSAMGEFRDFVQEDEQECPDYRFAGSGCKCVEAAYRHGGDGTSDKRPACVSS